MRIAIFGGSFDPIHKAHIAIINKLFNELFMDRVLIIPTNITYYKKNKAMLTYNERLELCKMAIKEVSSLANKDIVVSSLEENIGQNEGFSSTVIRVKEMYPNDELFTVIGSDSYNYITSWIKYEGIINNSKLIVATRPGSIIDKEGIGIDYIEMPLNDDISSTKIRKNIRELIINNLK